MAEQFIDYYAVLGVPSTATEAAIREQYRALALKYHPDVGGSAQQMSRLNAAYSVLSDEMLRANYDRVYGRYHSQHAADSSDIERMNTVVQILAAAKVQAKANAVQGVVWLVLGTVVTVVGYALASPGGTYFVLWGAVVFGAYQFVVGLHHFFNPQLLVKKRLGAATYQRIFAGVPVKTSWKAAWILAALVVVVVVVVGVVGSYSDAQYPASYDSAFLSNCEAQNGATASYCSCALNKVHQDYNYQQAQALNSASSSSPEIQAIVQHCAGQ